MRYRDISVDSSITCANAVFEMVALQQSELIKQHFEGRQEQLTVYQKALNTEQDMLKKIDKAGLGNIAYLSELNKISWLQGRIGNLQEEEMLSQKHPTKLIVPIYASTKPVLPKRNLLLALGGLLGLMFGVFMVLVGVATSRISKENV
jgi:hypothetical protein